jgi:O-methyltransferase
MKPEDFDALIIKLKATLANLGPSVRIGIVGNTPVAFDLVQAIAAMQLQERMSGIYVPTPTAQAPESPYKPLEQLRADEPEILLIASDRDKERLIGLAIPFLTARTRILIGGFAHFEFQDVLFAEETGNALIPSFANGYPNSLIHLFQCLQNAARRNLEGVVVEFGMFKGGTTMLMSRFIEKLGKSWRVIGFDSFAGFPAPRSALDMYAHPDCVYLDEALVRRIFQGRNVEIIAGDIVETVPQINGSAIVLAFVDTDNFTSATAILDVIQDQVVPGGAIVFDHFTGRNRFLYTLGERMAAKRLLDDPRYFNLHDTGVFLRQQ